MKRASSRYVSTAKSEEIIDLKAVNDELVGIEKKIADTLEKQTQFLRELGLPPV